MHNYDLWLQNACGPQNLDPKTNLMCKNSNIEIELTHIVKSESTRTEVVDGSNESLGHPDEELHPHLRKYSPLQKNFKKSSVA